MLHTEVRPPRRRTSESAHHSLVSEIASTCFGKIIARLTHLFNVSVSVNLKAALHVCKRRGCSLWRSKVTRLALRGLCLHQCVFFPQQLAVSLRDATANFV